MDFHFSMQLRSPSSLRLLKKEVGELSEMIEGNLDGIEKFGVNDPALPGGA